MGKAAVKERTKTEAAAPAPVTTCRHHWVIETPRGALSNGRCKRCGEVREFRNSANDYIWDDDSSSGYNTWSGVRSTPKASHDDDDMAASSGTGAGVAVAV